MTDAAIDIRNVTKRFGHLTAVNDVSFSVTPGECFGLIGPNGAGKTTTFSMMCGYLHPTSGALRIMDVDPSEPGALRGKVGVLPQDAVLPGWAPIGELLTYWARLSRIPNPAAEARAALEKVELADTWAKRAPTLSHGMAKRIGIAQAIMGAPPVVLLDEPTAGLDPKVAAHIRQLIKEMRGRQTVVVSSHNLQELEELCDAAAILDRGRVVQAGTMASLTSRAEEFRVVVGGGTSVAIAVEELKLLPGVAGVRYDEALHTVVVQISGGGEHQAEPVITATLKALIERGVLISAVTRGRRLEERVLQLT